MRDVLENIQPRYAFLVKKKAGVTLGFGENRGEQIANSYDIFARIFNVQNGSLEHALESESLLRVHVSTARLGLDASLKEVIQVLLKAGKVATACRNDFLAFFVLGNCVKQVLKHKKLVRALLGNMRSSKQNLFNVPIKHQAGSIMHFSGYSFCLAI